MFIHECQGKAINEGDKQKEEDRSIPRKLWSEEGDPRSQLTR